MCYQPEPPKHDCADILNGICGILAVPTLIISLGVMSLNGLVAGAAMLGFYFLTKR